MDVLALARGVVMSTLTVMKTARETVAARLPRWAQATVRDVRRVLDGVLAISPSPDLNAARFVRLWAHEAMRIFGDRLQPFEKETGAITAMIYRRVNEMEADSVESKAALHKLLFMDHGEPGSHGYSAVTPDEAVALVWE